MASAMITGLIACGVPARQIRVVAPSSSTRQRLRETFGVSTQTAPHADFGRSDVLVLAVKPQQLQAAVRDLLPHMTGGLIVSLVAGVSMDTLQRLFNSSRVVRAMPNTPALLGQGMTGLTAPVELDATDRAVASALATAMGQCLWVEGDEQLNAVTALSGSGPAYLFYLIEAMEHAALTLGLSAAQGRQLAVSTFHGAALLASQSAEATSLLRERVTSTGGTTQAAIQVLDTHCVQQTFVQAIQAAASRCQEINAELGLCQAMCSVSEQAALGTD